MKKTILVAAALCICSMSMKAQDTKEEGFVFTTVKENLSKIKTVRVRVGASLPLVFLNQNCSGWAKENMISLKCSWFIIQW